MKFLMEIFKMTLHRIQQTKITSIFLIFGLTLSILIVSIVTGFTYEYLLIRDNNSDIAPPNGKIYTFYSESNQRFGADVMKQLFDGVRKETGAIWNEAVVQLDKKEVNHLSSLNAEWFTQDDGWHYPLVSGRYYTAKEIKEGEKVALIGTDLEECVRKDNKKQYIDISGEAYEVLGIVGIENEVSQWDSMVFMPCTALPDVITREYTFTSIFESLLLYNEAGDLKKDKAMLQKNGAKIDSKFEIRAGDTQKDDIFLMVNLMRDKNPMVFLLGFLGYFVVLIYAVNIVIFWLEKRHYEIGLRKAFGYTDKEIAKLIFEEMFGLAILSCIIAIGIQAVLGKVIGRISMYTLKLYIPNIITALVVVVLTAFLTSIWPVIRTLKIPPADTLKEGE